MSETAPVQRQLTVDEAMQLAIQNWRGGQPGQAVEICNTILKHRPRHRGAQHLLMTLQSGVQSLVFTAIGLNDPAVHDIGPFSYGVPSVMGHNQPTEPVYLKIGSFCTIGHQVEIIMGAYHRQDWFTIYPFSAPHFGSLFKLPEAIPDFSATRGGVVIGSDVWIGAHAVILSGVTIGDGAVIGAGAVVSRDVGPYEIWTGNPAAYRRRRFEDDVAGPLRRSRWWDWPKELVEQHARLISGAGPQSLAKLEEVAAALWAPAAVQGTGYVDQWVRTQRHRLRVRTLSSPRADLPAMLVLHGSFGSIETVFSLAQELQAFCNPVFVDMPGFGQSPAPEHVTLPAYADAMLEVVDALGLQSWFVCGASFGGAVGLAMAARAPGCRGVVAIDTPMLAAKLWHNHQFLRNVMALEPDNCFARQFAFSIYGVAVGVEVERNYFPLLQPLRQPVLVLTGDVPFEPKRAMPPVPVCLDEADLAVLRTFPNVQVAAMSGGHDLVHENPREVLSRLREFVSRVAA